MIIRTNLRIWLIVLISTFAACWSTAHAKIIYVDSNPIFFGGDGTSWPTAFKYLQDALSAAEYGDQIWVAAGTYKPTKLTDPNDPRTATFQMINGVVIYGGFPDMGIPDFTDRNPDMYETILSGDLNSDDIIDPNKTENSYHVVTASYTNPNTILDGFIITAGNASGPEPDSYGAGIYNNSGNLQIQNCKILNNSTGYFNIDGYNFIEYPGKGGGMYNYSSSPQITNCQFIKNRSVELGGAIYNDAGSSPILTNCIFKDNSAGLARTFSIGPDQTISVAFGKAGGIYNTAGSDPTLTNCTFEGNSTVELGGAMVNIDSSPTIINCIFNQNIAPGNFVIYWRTSQVGLGGGVVNYNSNPEISFCTFTNNRAGNGGGIYNDPNSCPTVTDCIFTENIAYYFEVIQIGLEMTMTVVSGSGGGICNTGTNPIVTNCNFTANEALWDGGGISNTNSNPTVIDCTFNGNLVTGIPNNSHYNGPFEFMGGGMSNHESNPTVTNCSFTKNKAGNGAGMSNDSNSCPLVTECVFSQNLASYSGIFMIGPLQWIEVTEGGGSGMYNSGSSPIVTNCTFTGNEALLTGAGMRNYQSSPTVTNCTFSNNEAGFGGGINNDSNSNPVLTDCVFSRNSASYVDASIIGINTLGIVIAGGGGGVCNTDSNPIIINCAFTGNAVLIDGGAMSNTRSDPIITNCIFTGNWAKGSQGEEGVEIPDGVQIQRLGLTSGHGGAINNDASNCVFTNCTFTGNMAENGNAISSCDSVSWSDRSSWWEPSQSLSSNAQLINCILWDGGDEIYNNDGSTITITYSDVQDGWPSGGNIDADPCFVDPGYWDPNDTPEDPNDDFWVDGDYHLKPSSPCIDAGDPCYVTGPDDVDKDGNPRVVDGDGDGIARIDMGPYEFQKKYCDGAGTPEDPYLICAPLHMHQIGVNHDDWDRHFKLTADIDLSAYTDTQFNIIGWYEGGLNNEPFTGVFDGNGHTISNFTYTSAGASYVGLFGYVAGETAAIRNLGLIGPNITCADGISIGTLAGCIAEGTVSNCYVKGGTVTGNEMVGGLAGRTGVAAVSRCFTTCDVMGNDWGIGGLIGDARQTTISACYATGSVTADNWGVGGLIGYQYAGQILTSYATGPVRGTDNGVGGLVGNAEGVYIEHCYAAGSVSGFDEVGGFAGRYSDGDILASFWDTLATGQVDGIGYEDQNGTVELFGRNTAQMRQQANFTGYGWDFVGESANGTEDVWTIWERAYYPRLTWENSITGDFTIDSNWMYQNLPGATNSAITTTVSVTNDPLANNSYTYRWEFALPEDVATAPTTTGSCGPDDPCCTFAALGCDQPAGLSDSGQPLTIQVTVIGDDYGNTGHAQAEFGIALLGDVNNDCVVNIADRAIINAFWRLGAAGPYTFTDCNINCDSSVNVADRAIANGIWRGALGQNSVSQPCPLR